MLRCRFDAHRVTHEQSDKTDGKGRNPHLHQVYLNITNPFNVISDSLDIDKAKSVYMDGTYDYFFSNWIPFYMNRKTLDGRTFTKAEIQAMSEADKVSVYVDYLAHLGTKLREPEAGSYTA